MAFSVLVGDRVLGLLLGALRAAVPTAQRLAVNFNKSFLLTSFPFLLPSLSLDIFLHLVSLLLPLFLPLIALLLHDLSFG